eukprot:130459_1
MFWNLCIVLLSVISHINWMPTLEQFKLQIGEAVWNAAIRVPDNECKSIPGKSKALTKALKPVYQLLAVCKINGCNKNTWDKRLRYHPFINIHLKKDHKRIVNRMTDQSIMNCMQVVSKFKPVDDTNKRFEAEFRFVNTNDLSAIVINNNNVVNNNVNNDNANNNNVNDNASESFRSYKWSGFRKNEYPE